MKKHQWTVYRPASRDVPCKGTSITGTSIEFHHGVLKVYSAPMALSGAFGVGQWCEVWYEGVVEDGS